MNRRERMRTTNKKIREWLLEKGYDDIWFKAHGKQKDMTFTQRGNYYSTDLWNLFDGICFDDQGNLVLLQMKTNGWADSKEIQEWLMKRKNLNVLVFNVTNKPKECKGKFKLFYRSYVA